MDGVSSQPVMQVIVYNPVYNVENARQGSKKTGVTCLLTEARSGKSDQKERLEDLIKSLQENSPKLYGTKVLDTTSIDALPVVNTCFGQCLVGSFGSYQLSVTESIYGYICNRILRI
ncbi:unnamed protein product [Pocillopora meandrina]|uniref:Uncharacterized protein n=1 Tax=Pocillopora meandrina TaxID=46732 RepID=A0AAU9W8S7_9CNID|nr:unnamed protein product [Pocillopora meandrina]